MKYYFCDVHIQSRQDEEEQIFIVLDNKNIDKPELTKEILMSNNNYKLFVQKYKPKLVNADYKIYSIEKEIFASTSDEDLRKLIEQAELVGSSEIVIEKKKINLNKKKKYNTKNLAIVFSAVVAVIAVFAFSAGKNVGKNSAVSVMANTHDEYTTDSEDGMIIPRQEDISEGADQITVTIDRSYSSSPISDLQLKGEVIDGKAKITLPEFDKQDFFTHVPGYTWGFTSDPNGEKIEYYGGATYSFTKDTKLYRVSVKYGGGSGTKDDPYLIDYYDQLELMGQEKARGYFKQIADIEFPSWQEHKPIDTVNELKRSPDVECFEYNGNGFSISNLTAPLFGKVSGAVIKNINITNSNINTQEYKNFGFILCEAYNYRYVAENQETDTTGSEDTIVYETGETEISHCKVSHSSINIALPQTENEPKVEVENPPEVVPPNLIEYDEKGNVIKKQQEEIIPTKQASYAIGAISGVGG